MYGLIPSNTLDSCRLLTTPLQTVWTQIRPDKMSGLIWVQTVCHSDGIPETILRKSSFLKKNHKTTKKHVKLPSIHECIFSFKLHPLLFLTYSFLSPMPKINRILSTASSFPEADRCQNASYHSDMIALSMRSLPFGHLTTI